jgi:flagellar hook protein FlgE
MKAATRAQDGRGGINPMQVGLGVSVGSIDTDHTQGSRESTGKTTDLAIEGNGFFILQNGNNRVYSRAGAFDLDENGNLVVPGTGMKVQGWVNGLIQDIVISDGEAYSAEPTSNIYFANNLNAYAAGGEKTFTATADVYDSLGGLHTVELEFQKVESDPSSNTEVNQWTWTVKRPGLYHENTGTTSARFSGTTLTNVANATENLSFTVYDSHGEAVPVDFTLTVDGAGQVATLSSADWNDDIVLNFDGYGALVSPSNPISVSTGAGAIELDFSGITMAAATDLSNLELVNSNQLEQSGMLLFGADGALLAQDNNSITMRPQVEKTLDWSKYAPIDPAVGWSQAYDGVDGKIHTIQVAFSQVSGLTGAYTWAATDSVDGVASLPIASGTYDATAKTHTGDPIVYTTYSAASKMNITMHFENVTSSEGENSLAVAARDGARNGTLKSYSIDSSGTIVGEFTNGMMRSIGQIALAKFANPAGLQQGGNTTFIESNNSGIAQTGKAGAAGFGNITPGALEMSNVDLSQEFTNMIIAQRGLQASSRIITTSDEVLQELVNLKR